MNRRTFRWRVIVDWRLQGSLCLHGLLYGSLVLVAVSAGLFVPLLWDLTDRTDATQDQAVVMLYMHERFWRLAGLCLFLIVLGAVRFSHRIAGPLVRFKRNLRLMADGKLPEPLRTRPGDYMKAEVNCLNDAVAGLTTRVEAIQQAHAALERELQAAAARMSRQAAFELGPVLAASRDLQCRIDSIERFDTRDDAIELETVPSPSPSPSQLALAGRPEGA